MSADRTIWPRRVVSWWSELEDLQWPEQRVRDMVQRRADELAAAQVDTAIQFGFHYRFDFTPYFGQLHGLLRDVADALRARSIRFLDHYSCNCIARPRTGEDAINYTRCNRHCVPIYPDAQAAETMAYGGFRFNDLREIDVETGEPAYVPRYQCELFCHNNTNYLAMHEAYLRRQIEEVGFDGIMADDMCDYAAFRACSCRHCRARFARDFGHELPPFGEKSFWGDTSKDPYYWGNYDNPAFRAWVATRHRSMADHLALVKRVIGDRILMTCCSNSGPLLLNSLGLSYENFLPHCDWVMLENCGVTAESANWARTEPEAMLSRAVARRKSPPPGAPPIALSYSIYEDGAYLAWAVARFWGTPNWFSTLSHALPVAPPDARSDAELIGPYHQWEQRHSDLDPRTGQDVVELRLAFTRAARDNGWRDERGADHWQRVQRWSAALLANDIGYRFVTTDELADADVLMGETTPLVLDGCAHLSDAVCESLRRFVEKGGTLWVAPPLGSYDEKAQPRRPSLLEQLGGNVIRFDPVRGPAELGNFSPRIRRLSGPENWRVRLRVQDENLVVHLLNGQLRGVPHPHVKDRWLRSNVLARIESPGSSEPLVLELDLRDLPGRDDASLVLQSPELPDSLAIEAQPAGGGRMRCAIDLSRVRMYGVVSGEP